MIDFGERCINCRSFVPDTSENQLGIFGTCMNPGERKPLGKIHMFSGCKLFAEKPQIERPAIAQRADFALERKKWYEDRFLTK